MLYRILLSFETALFETSDIAKSGTRYFSGVGQMVKFTLFLFTIVSNFFSLNLCFYNMKVHLIRKMFFPFSLICWFFRDLYYCGSCFSVYPSLKEKSFTQIKYSSKSGWIQPPWNFLLTSWIFRKTKISF